MYRSTTLIKQGLFRIQYASNLQILKHVSLSHMIKPVAPYLALVGHCGTTETIPFLFQYSSTEFEKVFYVPGPNDPPYSWLEQSTKQFKNVHLLQRDSHYLPEYNLSIVGTTWWKNNSSWARRGYPISRNVLNSYDTNWIQSHVERNVNQYCDTILLTHHTFPYQYHSSIRLHIYGDDTKRCAEYVDQTIKGVNPNKVSNAYVELAIPTIETEERVENSLIFKSF